MQDVRFLPLSPSWERGPGVRAERGSEGPAELFRNRQSPDSYPSIARSAPSTCASVPAAHGAGWL